MCSYASIVPSDTEVETILVEHVMESSAMDYPDDEVDSHQSLDHSCDHSSYVSLAEALSAVGQQHDPLSDISNIDGGKSLLVSQKKDAPGPTNMELFSASREVATKWLEMGKLDALIATSCNAASGSPAVDYYCTPSQGQIKYIDVPKQPRDDVSCVNGTGCSPLTVDSSLSVSLPLGDTGRLVGGSSADNFGARSHRSDDPPDSLIDPVRSEQAFEIFQRAGFGCPRRHRREELLLHPKGRPRGPVSRGRQQCESKTIGTSTTLTPGRSHTQRPAPVPVATLVVDSPCRSTRRPRNSLLLQQRELPALEPGSWHPTVPLKSVSSRDPEPSISLPFPRSHSGRFAGNTMAGSHWKSAQDPRTGRTYYYHETTRETQWRKPPELASEAEKKAMEEKERKQKDFFAAMEANILNSLSQGQVPGTPKTQDTLERRRSSRKPAERPELVRTISTMDDIVLKNLIQRQPSFRNIKQNALSKTASLNPGDFEVSKRSSHIATSDFESFVSIMSDHQRLDPLHESMISNDDSMPELFNYLPDEGEFSMGESIVSIEDGHRGNNESNETSYGLTREEAQALKKLASITKEMIDVEKEDIEFVDLPKKGAAGATPSWRSKDAKGMRDLPREIELDESDDDDDDDDESDRPDQKANTAPLGAFQKAKDIGGRELDFDSDEEDDETTSDMAPTPMQKKTAEEKKDINVKKKDPTMERPEVKRRNTCGTLYVGTTMSAPDKDATIKVRMQCCRRLLHHSGPGRLFSCCRSFVGCSAYVVWYGPIFYPPRVGRMIHRTMSLESSMTLRRTKRVVWSSSTRMANSHKPRFQVSMK